MKRSAVQPQVPRRGAEPATPRLPASIDGAVGLLAGRCPVSGRLLARARLREPLTPVERHVLIQIFTHLGEDGRRFIHQVLAATPGYDPDDVNRAIRAVPPQPIGCAKIRRLLAKDGAPDLCGCVFRLPEQAYAAPIVHLDRFPLAEGKLRTERNPAPNLDGDGRQVGYLSRLAKAASRLMRLGDERD